MKLLYTYTELLNELNIKFDTVERLFFETYESTNFDVIDDFFFDYYFNKMIDLKLPFIIDFQINGSFNKEINETFILMNPNGSFHYKNDCDNFLHSLDEYNRTLINADRLLKHV